MAKKDSHKDPSARSDTLLSVSSLTRTKRSGSSLGTKSAMQLGRPTRCPAPVQNRRSTSFVTSQPLETTWPLRATESKSDVFEQGVDPLPAEEA